MSARIHRSLFALLCPLTVVAFAGSASADDGNHHYDNDNDNDNDTDNDGHNEIDALTIYTQTNAVGGNQVLAFENVDGVLTSLGSYPTGGAGSGRGLGSQGAVVTDDEHLLAVNAGSNELSLFSIEDDGSLTLGDTESSGGVNPVSVTVHGNVAYVANAGDRTVNGFRIEDDRLEPIVGSHRALPGNGAAQISFDRSGQRLVVTEKATNTIDVLPVSRRGVAGAAVANPSTGQTPFGFAIDRRNHLIVSNAAGGGAGASSASSYRFDGPAGLIPTSSAVANTQSAACWIALSGNQKYAYTTNTASGSISSYGVARDGSLTLVQAVAATPGAGPIDMVEANGSLFTLNNGSHTISADLMGGDGSLTSTNQVSVPIGVVGLAAG